MGINVFLEKKTAERVYIYAEEGADIPAGGILSVVVYVRGEEMNPIESFTPASYAVRVPRWREDTVAIVRRKAPAAKILFEPPPPMDRELIVWFLKRRNHPLYSSSH